MSRKNVHIEKLQIRVPKSAKLSASGLGNEVLNQIAANVSAQNGVRRVGSVDAGKIKTSGGADLQQQIARRIGEAVGEKTK